MTCSCLVLQYASHSAFQYKPESHAATCRDALQAGLGQKRKAEEPSKKAAVGKRRYLDALDDANDSNSDSDED